MQAEKAPALFAPRGRHCCIAVTLWRRSILEVADKHTSEAFQPLHVFNPVYNPAAFARKHGCNVAAAAL